MTKQTHCVAARLDAEPGWHCVTFEKKDDGRVLLDTRPVYRWLVERPTETAACAMGRAMGALLGFLPPPSPTLVPAGEDGLRYTRVLGVYGPDFSEEEALQEAAAAIRGQGHDKEQV